MASIFIETPGDLSHPTQLILMNNMVDDFEKLHGSWGPVGTMYFVRDFVTFENYLQSDSNDYDYDPADGTTTLSAIDALKFKNEDLPSFLVWPEYDFWSGFIRLKNATPDGNATFHATVFHEDGIFLDLIDNMPTDTWQSVLGTLVCMAAVCFVFLRSLLTVAIATTCVLSICVGQSITLFAPGTGSLA
ncbi:unnamed protein product [Gongylonema pulchrum]|uniref:MMPL domain-containing protein n=1 Tax=Gongylonema pulchrum TaxID=637853 RepID=A0A183D521_9BILA|nr:unnamed protein product [Gongylonema pulchrum]